MYDIAAPAVLREHAGIRHHTLELVDGSNRIVVSDAGTRSLSEAGQNQHRQGSNHDHERSTDLDESPSERLRSRYSASRSVGSSTSVEARLHAQRERG